MWVEAMLDQLVLASKGLRAGNVSKLTELGAGDAPRAMPSYVMNEPQVAKPDFLRLKRPEYIDFMTKFLLSLLNYARISANAHRPKLAEIRSINPLPPWFY